MEISLSELKEKEIVNIFDGKKLGRIIDILFDIENGMVRGIVVPGEKKIFKKNEDIFIPLEKLKKIGNDVVLVKIPVQIERESYSKNSKSFENKRYNYYGGQGYKNNQYFQNNFTENHPMNIENERNVVNNNHKGQSQLNSDSYVRFKPINNKKYK